MYKIRTAILMLATFTLVILGGAPPTSAIELLTNGDFEAGTFTGWTVTDQVGGFGSFFIDTPGTIAPAGFDPTAANPLGGAFYAVSDQGGPGTNALLEQSFTVPGPAISVILSFEMFVDDWSGVGPIINPAGLDFTADPNQHGRVDILSAGSPPFDTGAGVWRIFSWELTS